MRNLGPDLDREILRNLGPTEEQVHFRKPGPTRTGTKYTFNHYAETFSLKVVGRNRAKSRLRFVFSVWFSSQTVLNYSFINYSWNIPPDSPILFNRDRLIKYKVFISQCVCVSTY